MRPSNVPASCRADTFEALFDYATAFNLQPLPKGDRVLIITNAGGPGTMAADAVEKAGMRVADLDRNAATALRSQLPAAASIGNPIDVLGDAEPDRYVAALMAAQQDEQVDAILVILTPQAMTRPRETARPSSRTWTAPSRCWPRSWAARTSCPAARNWPPAACPITSRRSGPWRR